MGGHEEEGSLARAQAKERDITQRKLCSAVAWPVTSRGQGPTLAFFPHADVEIWPALQLRELLGGGVSRGEC